MGLRIVSHNLLGPRKCSAEAGFLHGDTDVLGPFYCSFPHVFVHIDANALFCLPRGPWSVKK